jgi:hypothetical protein
MSVIAILRQLRKTGATIGLQTADEVRAIRLLAGIADDEPSDPILEFVGGSTREYQYLLVTAKAEACGHVAVFEKGFRHPEQVFQGDANTKVADRLPCRCPELRW